MSQMERNEMIHEWNGLPAGDVEGTKICWGSAIKKENQTGDLGK